MTISNRGESMYSVSKLDMTHCVLVIKLQEADIYNSFNIQLMIKITLHNKGYYVWFMYILYATMKLRKEGFI